MDFHSILFHLTQILFIGSFFLMSIMMHGEHVVQRHTLWGHKGFFPPLNELRYYKVQSKSTLSKYHHSNHPNICYLVCVGRGAEAHQLCLFSWLPVVGVTVQRKRRFRLMKIHGWSFVTRLWFSKLVIMQSASQLPQLCGLLTGNRDGTTPLELWSGSVL